MDLPGKRRQLGDGLLRQERPSEHKGKRLEQNTEIRYVIEVASCFICTLAQRLHLHTRLNTFPF